MTYHEQYFGPLTGDALAAWHREFLTSRLPEFLEDRCPVRGRAGARTPLHASLVTAVIGAALERVFLRCLGDAHRGTVQHPGIEIGTTVARKGRRADVIVVARWIAGPTVEEVAATIRALAPPGHRLSIVCARLISDREQDALRAAVGAAWHVVPPEDPGSRADGTGPSWPPRWWTTLPFGNATIAQTCIDWLRLNIDRESGQPLGPVTPFVPPPSIGESLFALHAAAAREYFLQLLPWFPSGPDASAISRTRETYLLVAQGRRGSRAGLGAA